MNTISFSSAMTPRGSVLWTTVKFPDGNVYQFPTRTHRTNRRIRAAFSKVLERAILPDIAFYRKSLALLA